MEKIAIKLDNADLTFSCSHFLHGFGKCDRLHGHNYRIKVILQGDIEGKNALVDFSTLKKVLSTLISKIDHKIILPGKSVYLIISNKANSTNIEITSGKKYYSIPREDIALLPLEATTCERLSIYFHGLIQKEFPGMEVTVTISETSSNSATYPGKIHD
ncbi:MAG: 6-pyruvoyl trahydropterin synthase family protein [Candidatus Hodarchaeales archaeon]